MTSFVILTQPLLWFFLSGNILQSQKCFSCLERPSELTSEPLWDVLQPIHSTVEGLDHQRMKRAAPNYTQSLRRCNIQTQIAWSSTPTPRSQGNAAFYVQPCRVLITWGRASEISPSWHTSEKTCLSENPRSENLRLGRLDSLTWPAFYMLPPPEDSVLDSLSPLLCAGSVLSELCCWDLVHTRNQCAYRPTVHFTPANSRCWLKPFKSVREVSGGGQEKLPRGRTGPMSSMGQKETWGIWGQGSYGCNRQKQEFARLIEGQPQKIEGKSRLVTNCRWPKSKWWRWGVGVAACF